MELFPFRYYHVSNRSIDAESVFRHPASYNEFLNGLNAELNNKAELLGYCLTPRAFHLLIYVRTFDVGALVDAIERAQGLYRKAFNKRYDRCGRCFEKETQTYNVDDEVDAIRLLAWLHRLPVEQGLCSDKDQWAFSSYREYIGVKKDARSKCERLMNYFLSIEEFRSFSDIETGMPELRQRV